MSSLGLTPEDFKRLPQDGARFESMVCQLLEAMGYRVLEKPAIGSEGGRDVLVERKLADAMGERRERVVVQCKHYAHSKKAVNEGDIGIWDNALKRYKARGYLLVTDTRVTENLSRAFREFSDDPMHFPNWATFWDVDQLILHLGQHPRVRDVFFPLEAPKQTSLQSLADEVGIWLRAVKYKVNQIEQNRNRIDLEASFEEGSIRQKVIVRCVGGDISARDVDKLDRILDRNTSQGWLISDKRLSEKAKEAADKRGSVRVFNLASFLREMIWGKYFGALTTLVETERIPTLYVDLHCYKLEIDAEGREVSRDPRKSLDIYIDEWLTERGKMHISLLGEFGSGKTWFCRHYAHRQLARFLKDPVSERLPLLITLRMFAKSMTAQQLINDALLEQYSLPFVGSAYDVFQEMNRRGKLLLILDGFDEMARQVDYQTVVDNFWELAKLVTEGSKVILTSRTEYFRWAKESERIFGGEESGRRTILLEPPTFEVLYIEPFDPDQIRKAISLRLGDEKGSLAADRILHSKNLAEMARKVILVELLLTALTEVNVDVLETLAQVYLYATNKLLLRNISAEKTFTSTSDKLYFLCELAWEMVRSGELRIHYTSIPQRIREYFGERIKGQLELDHWDFDLRAQTLLHRDAVGYYEFAHKSLAEYFVALKFAAELGCLSPAFSSTYREANGIPCVLLARKKSILKLTETFGTVLLSDHHFSAVRDLLREMINGDSLELLWDLVFGTKGKTAEQVGYVGSNAAVLLNQLGQSFSERDLSEANLMGVELVDANFTRTNLHAVQLQEARLINPILVDADLTKANLTKCKLGEDPGVDGMCYVTNDSQLLVAVDDGTIKSLDIDTESSSLSFRTSLDDDWDTKRWFRPYCSWIAKVSPDGKSIASGLGSIYGIMSGSFVVWDARTTDPWIQDQVIKQGVNDLAFSADGRCVFLGCGNEIHSGLVNSEGMVVHWDLVGKRELQRLQCDSMIWSIAYNSAHKLLAVARDDGEIEILSANDLKRLHFFKAHNSFIPSVSFSPDGRYLASAGGYQDASVRVWEVGTYKRLDKLKGHLKVLPKRESLAVRSVSYHRGSRYLVSGGDDGQVIVWDLERSKQELTLIGHKKAVTSAHFSPSGRHIASSSRDGTIRVWDFDRGGPGFGKCLKVFAVNENYKGLRIDGALGLEEQLQQDIPDDEVPLLELLRSRGAVLSQDQIRLLETHGRAPRESSSVTRI